MRVTGVAAGFRCGGRGRVGNASRIVGRALLPRIRPVFGHVTGQLLEGFTREEIIELTGMLERMLGNLRDVRALEDNEYRG